MDYFQIMFQGKAMNRISIAMFLRIGFPKSETPRFHGRIHGFPVKFPTHSCDRNSEARLTPDEVTWSSVVCISERKSCGRLVY
jgi:hypothetical protein